MIDGSKMGIFVTLVERNGMLEYAESSVGQGFQD